MAFREVTVEVPQTLQLNKYVPNFDKVVSTLPSGGKAYPKNLEIKYRPYTFGEVKTISQTGQSNLTVRDRILEILKGVQVSNGFDPLNLTLQDVFCLGFLRKVRTFATSNKISIPHFCDGCKKPTQFVLEENEVLDFNDIKAPSLPISFNMYDETFEFSPLTVKNYFDYLDYVLKSIDLNEEVDTGVAVMAAQCISHSFEDSYRAIFNAGPNESSLLAEIDSLLNHDLKPIEMYCRNKKGEEICNYKTTIKLDEVDRLVLPFRSEHEEPTTSGLHFGKKLGNKSK